jgi:hypothetical protein
VCIQLDPPIPGKDWACLPDRYAISVPSPSGPLVIQPCSHMRELIQDGFLSRKVCTISWEYVDAGGNAIIVAVECRQ